MGFNNLKLRSFCPVFLLLFLCFFDAKAQNIRYRPEALFILDIAPDARSSGGGNTGAATKPDVMSQKWNASKYIFAESAHGISASYTPWLNKIAKGLNMGYLSGYSKFGDKSAVGISATYLSIEGIDLTGMDRSSQGSISADEYAIDASYSHKLSERLSGGITLRYASAIKVQSVNIPNHAVLRPSAAFAGDVAFFYTQPIETFSGTNNLAAGICISNLGTKVKLSSDEEMLMPMNLRFGVTYSMQFNQTSALATSFDLNKSLVPYGAYASDITVFEAIGKSFNKSREVVYALGLEYSYMKTAMLRAGYHHPVNSKSLRCFTLGAGLVYRSLNFDASYLISSSNISAPLSNVFRISISYVWN